MKAEHSQEHGLFIWSELPSLQMHSVSLLRVSQN